MDRRRLFIETWAAWAPGTTTETEWKVWAEGTVPTALSDETPALEFLPPLFRRRLSQLSKMVLHVGHQVKPRTTKTPCIFASQYGETNQQAQITQSILDSGEISPSAFSLSVFNTPVSLLSIAEKLQGPGIALGGGPETCGCALMEAWSRVESSPEPGVLLILGEELVPEPYRSHLPEPIYPYAAAFRISQTGGPGSIWVDFDSSGVRSSGMDFLRTVIQGSGVLGYPGGEIRVGTAE